MRSAGLALVAFLATFATAQPLKHVAQPRDATPPDHVTSIQVEVQTPIEIEALAHRDILSPAAKGTSATKRCPPRATPTAGELVVVPGNSTSVPQKRRIAIVGAGASGAGAAFFLQRAARVVEAERGLAPGSLLEIVVFEKNDYIGGRSTIVHPYDSPSGHALEVGGAILVDSYLNLRKVAAKFGLTMEKLNMTSGAPLNIWDGKNVVYTQHGLPSIDVATHAERYGPNSHSLMTGAATTLLEKIVHGYDASFLAQRGAVNSIEEYASAIGLGAEYTSRTGLDYAVNIVGTTSQYANEYLDTNTRSNVGADVTEINGLAAAYCAAGSAVPRVLMVQGGNFQMFEAMLNDSSADVRLNTEVKRITPSGSGYTVVSSSKSKGNDTYDEIFWANPWHLSPVSKSLQAHFTTPIPKQEYVKMHVTHLTTQVAPPRSRYFNQPDDFYMALSIATTGQRARSTRNKKNQPAFITLQYVWLLKDSTGEYVVQISSHEALSNRDLVNMFGVAPTWVHRKAWDAYPLLKPTTKYPPVQPRRGFHYLAAMEPWLSTMETQTVSAREAVARAVQGWWSLGLGQCKDGSSWDLSCDPEPQD